MQKIKKYLVKLILIFFLLILGNNLINLISYFYDSKNNNIEGLYVEKEIGNPSVIYINPPYEKNDIYYQLISENFLDIALDHYFNQNNDTVGWIEVSGTNVNYPFVQTSDNKYYLNHNFNKTKNKAGWIFADFRNNFQNLNYNTIIYGHRRVDGSMFGTLKNLLSSTWFQENMHHLIKIKTLNNNYLFQIFSVYTIKKESYYLKTFFVNKDEFNKFLKTIIERSEVKFNTSISDKDKILTLSTCLDNFGNRIVIHARLIKKES